MVKIAGDIRCSHYLKQSVSLAIQRGNAARFLGSSTKSAELNATILTFKCIKTNNWNWNSANNYKFPQH